ncbi:MAG: tetratricopeptide repeat protein, partial [Planctomycetota bacterium]
KEIHYYDAPQAFRTAVGLVGSKKYREAIEQFDAAEGAGAREWLKVHALFHKAECYRLLGAQDASNYDTAVEMYDALLKEAPLTRFLAPALYYKGVSLRNAKKYGEANKAFQQLITEVGTKSLEESWASKADIAQARVKEAQGLFDEAEPKYDSIYQLNKSKDPAIANMALLRKGICKLKRKRYQEAKKYFEDLARKAEGEGMQAREVRAGAAIGMGHCFYNDKNYLDARHWYLKAMVVYFSDEFNPEAMFHAADCYEKLKGKEKGAGERAKWIFSDLISRYPNSEWAKKAEGMGFKDLKQD